MKARSLRLPDELLIKVIVPGNMILICYMLYQLRLLTKPYSVLTFYIF